ncbi:MAG: right-handed parallel beta-helix repeat-containing protein [Bacteroidota bacterium]
MKSLPLFLFTLFFFFAFKGFSTTYYLDATNGANNQNGLSPQKAWKDLFKIRGVTPEPEDTFLFKRGETWRSAQLYIDTSGNEQRPILFGAYGDSNDPMPVIDLTDTVAMSNVPMSWTESSPNIWEMPFTRNIGRLFVDNVELLRADSTDMVGLNDSEGQFGHWYVDLTTNKFYLYATSNPAIAHTTIMGGITQSNQIDAILAFQSDYLIFDNLDIRGGARAALSLFGCQHVTVRNCKIGRSANSGVLIINTATSGTETRISSNIVVHNNAFFSHFKFYHGLGTERGCGDGIKLFDGAINCTIRNNTFKNWAHNAVELLAVNTAFTGVNQNKIHDNHISAPDIPYSHPLGADGSLNRCQQNEFFRNTIENCRTTSQINGNNNHVHHNIIKNMRSSPAKNTPTGFAFTLAVYGPTLVSQDNIFEHNLILYADEAAFQVIGFGHPQPVQNNVIRNNIIYETGQAPHGNSYPNGTGLYIFRRDGVNGNTYENNLFFTSLANAKAIFRQDENLQHTAIEFNQLNGVDGNSIFDNLTGNPLFQNLAGNDYHLLESSPAIDAGKNTALLIDFDLNIRIVGTQPDIGPYESNFIACPTDRTLHQNPILTYTYAAQNTISSMGTVTATENVVLKAGTSITLTDGFKVVAGGQMHAFIENCMPAAIRNVEKIEASSANDFTDKTGSKINLSVAPNPVFYTATITVSSHQLEQIQLNLRDVTGRIFWQKLNCQIAKGNNQLPLNTSQMPSGLYFLTAQSQQQAVTKKIIIL